MDCFNLLSVLYQNCSLACSAVHICACHWIHCKLICSSTIVLFILNKTSKQFNYPIIWNLNSMVSFHYNVLYSTPTEIGVAAQCIQTIYTPCTSSAWKIHLIHSNICRVGRCPKIFPISSLDVKVMQHLEANQCICTHTRRNNWQIDSQI